MTKLSDQQLMDLCKLAIERAEEAVGSVDQLIDDDEQSMLMMVAVIASMCMSAAEHMHQTVLMPNGKAPPRDIAFLKVLTLLVKAGAVEHLVEERRH